MTARPATPDVRALFALVLVITSLAIALGNPYWLAVLLLIALAVLVAMKIPLDGLGNRFWRYRWLFLLLILIQSLTNSSGKVYIALSGYVLLSAGGLLAALATLLRIAVILAAAQLLTVKDYQEMVTGLVQMGVPYELAYMVLLAVRFIPVLIEEFRHSLEAIELRGVDLKAIPPGKKIKLYSYILMPTTAGALIRSQRVAIAMEARAFRAYPQRTWLEWPQLGVRDWLVIVFAVLGGVGILWMKLKGVLA